jgi:GxxExxY protein
MPHDDEPTIYDRPEPSVEADHWARQVIGAAIEVHKHLGSGHSEQIYENALALEMTSRRIPFLRQVPVNISYKGTVVGEGRLDFLVGGCLVVEIKACAAILAIHRAQTEGYLAMTGHELALLLNFNVPLLKDGGIHRVVRTTNGSNLL